MQTSTHIQNNTATIKVSGRIDTTTYTTLEAEMDAITQKNIVDITIDIQDVDYLSSAAFRVFIKYQKTCRMNDGEVKLLGVSDTLMPLFKISGFDKLFTFIQ